jgi:isopenicillin-N N-acyltransferase like protein
MRIPLRTFFTAAAVFLLSGCYSPSAKESATFAPAAPMACAAPSNAHATSSNSGAASVAGPTTAPSQRVAPAGVAATPIASAPGILPTHVGDVPIIVLSGSPQEIGQQYGKALHDPIHILHDQYLLKFVNHHSTAAVAYLAAKTFQTYMLPSHVAECHALADSADLPINDCLLAQCFLDLTPMTACSTITLPASAAPDRVARFGRDLDFSSLGVADKYNVLFIYKPKGCYAFASIGWPGQIGVLSGMNQWGLCLANMEVKRNVRFPSGMPYVLLYRAVLENCKDVNEAIAYLKKTPRQTANNLMLMDATGHRAVAELTPGNVVVREAPDSAALVCTNHQRGQDLDTPGYCPRFDYLHDAAAQSFGTISLDNMKAMLGHVDQGDHTLQSMVFEPQNRVLYLATGLDAGHRPFYRVDLAPFFAASN